MIRQACNFARCSDGTRTFYINILTTYHPEGMKKQFRSRRIGGRNMCFIVLCSIGHLVNYADYGQLPGKGKNP